MIMCIKLLPKTHHIASGGFLKTSSPCPVKQGFILGKTRKLLRFPQTPPVSLKPLWVSLKALVVSLKCPVVLLKKESVSPMAVEASAISAGLKVITPKKEHIPFKT